MSHREKEIVPGRRTSDRNGTLSLELLHLFGIRKMCIPAEERRLLDGMNSSRRSGRQVGAAEVINILYIYPVNMPDPIRIRSRSGGKHWPEAAQIILEYMLAFGLDPFGQNLTQSARTKSDPGTILCGSSVDDSESKRGKLLAGRLRPARNQAR